MSLSLSLNNRLQSRFYWWIWYFRYPKLPKSLPSASCLSMEDACCQRKANPTHILWPWTSRRLQTEFGHCLQRVLRHLCSAGSWCLLLAAR